MSLKTFPFNFSNFRVWLTLVAVIWLLGSLGLGWLVNSLLIIVGLLFLTPILVFFGFRWWLQLNLVSDRCPVCRYEFSGLNNTQLQCPNCSEQLLVQQGHFKRFAPEGTIDVTAVEVPAKSLED
jgi:DNA-directed RNA polymerase subunit RPC12/RpoP